MSEALLTGLKIGESARWHQGRLWLSNWGTGQVLAVDLDGHTEVMATVPITIPFSIDWLPDEGARPWREAPARRGVQLPGLRRPGRPPVLPVHGVTSPSRDNAFSL